MFFSFIVEWWEAKEKSMLTFVKEDIIEGLNNHQTKNQINSYIPPILIPF